MKESLLYEQLKDYTVRCNVCQRRCVIREDESGWCRTRKNKAGRLFSLIYARVATWCVSPIEKKPMYHFYPGSRWLSLGTLGCNFRCPGCQNYDLSFAEIEAELKNTDEILPEEAIALAKRDNCRGISFTYNEPTIWFEYTLDCAKLAKQNGLLANYVTNGSITQEALDMIGPYLDSFRADIKGFSKEFYLKVAHLEDFTGVLEVTKRAKSKWNMYVEIVTNIIPGFSDDEKQLKAIADWIYRELGKDTPWHVTQFIPHLKLSYLQATSVSTLERARQIGKTRGLQYVYIGNIPGHSAQDTYCPDCGELLIQRDWFSVEKNNLLVNRCPKCARLIAGRFD